MRSPKKLQFLRIPIRDWNVVSPPFQSITKVLQFLRIPIRDWNVVGDGVYRNCNFYESLLGIETGSYQLRRFTHRRCNFYESLLGIETPLKRLSAGNSALLQFLRIPIRDWNRFLHGLNHRDELQFLRIPIRDWNIERCQTETGETLSCNFYESLLGIETIYGWQKAFHS